MKEKKYWLHPGQDKDIRKAKMKEEGRIKS